jgi:hypothetical protein
MPRHLGATEVYAGMIGNSKMIKDSDSKIRQAKPLPGLIVNTLAGREKMAGTIEGHIRHTIPENKVSGMVKKSMTPASATKVKPSAFGGLTYPGAGNF